MCFAANNILLTDDNQHHVCGIKMADCFPELAESHLNMKTNLVTEK